MLKEVAKTRVNTKVIAQFVTLAGVVTFLPFFIHLQWLSGPIVNAILILVLYIVGPRAALLVSVVPSLMALFGGLLPAPLAPIVPFIMIGNGIFVLVFYYWQNSKYSEINSFFFGAISASLVKFIFLFFSARLVIGYFVKESLAEKVVLMFSFPQLLTALSGSLIALSILKFLKRI